MRWRRRVLKPRWEVQCIHVNGRDGLVVKCPDPTRELAEAIKREFGKAFGDVPVIVLPDTFDVVVVEHE